MQDAVRGALLEFRLLRCPTRALLSCVKLHFTLSETVYWKHAFMRPNIQEEVGISVMKYISSVDRAAMSMGLLRSAQYRCLEIARLCVLARPTKTGFGRLLCEDLKTASPARTSFDFVLWVTSVIRGSLEALMCSLAEVAIPVDLIRFS